MLEFVVLRIKFGRFFGVKYANFRTTRIAFGGGGKLDGPKPSRKRCTRATRCREEAFFAEKKCSGAIVRGSSLFRWRNNLCFVFSFSFFFFFSLIQVLGGVLVQTFSAIVSNMPPNTICKPLKKTSVVSLACALHTWYRSVPAYKEGLY